MNARTLLVVWLVLFAAQMAYGQDTPDEATTAVAAAPTMASCGARTAQIEEVARKVRTREAVLASREQALKERARDLTEMESLIGSRISELTSLRGEIEADLERLETARDERVDALVARMKVMRAKAGAAVLTQVDTELAGQVLLRLDPRSAAGLLGAMPPGSAARLATYIAGEETS